MSLTAKLPPKKPRELPKNEMSQAVCAFIVDCGQHEETNDAGIVSLKPKVMYLFELEQKRSDGLPFIMAQTFTNSLHKKSSQRPFLEHWNGEGFTDAQVEAGVNLDALVGKGAYITPIYKVSKGNTYANIGSISKLREKDTNMAVTIREIPKWVNDYIAKAKVPPAGFTAPAESAQTEVQGSEDIPF